MLNNNYCDLLPNEIALHILSYSGVRSALNFAQCNKKMNMICVNEILWKEYCQRDWNETSKPATRNWKEFYQFLKNTDKIVNAMGINIIMEKSIFKRYPNKVNCYFQIKKEKEEINITRVTEEDLQKEEILQDEKGILIKLKMKEIEREKWTGQRLGLGYTITYGPKSFKIFCVKQISCDPELELICKKAQKAIDLEFEKEK